MTKYDGWKASYTVQKDTVDKADNSVYWTVNVNITVINPDGIKIVWTEKNITTANISSVVSSVIHKHIDDAIEHAAVLASLSDEPVEVQL